MRLTGTRPECDRFVAALLGATAPGVIREVSGFYPNRGASLLGRVYLDLDLPGSFACCEDTRLADLPSTERRTGGVS